MIKAVLDTNVLVSGIVSFKHPQRVPVQLIRAWQAGLFTLLISQHILIELERTLNKPYFKKYLSLDEIKQVLVLLIEDGTIIPITTEVHGVATHPEDDLILATAISANADYLVTGDQPLLQKVGDLYQKVNLVTPKMFLQILEQQN